MQWTSSAVSEDDGDVCVCERVGVFTPVPCAAFDTYSVHITVHCDHENDQHGLSSRTSLESVGLHLETVWRFDSPPQEFTMSGSVCRSLYAYNGDQHQQGLKFEAGEVIRVTQVLDGGWWEGEKDGVKGWFPSTYVQVEVSSSSRVCVCVCVCACVCVCVFIICSLITEPSCPNTGTVSARLQVTHLGY